MAGNFGGISRTVLIEDEAQFGKVLAKVLSPAKAIQTPEFLRGREQNLVDIRRALYAPGRHVFIHGFRGVGKTSLAQTAAFQLQASSALPIMYGCGDGTTFNEVISGIVGKGFGETPQLSRESSSASKGTSIGSSKAAVSSSRIKSAELNKHYSLRTVDEAVRLVATLVDRHSPKPVILIDEFDKVTDKKEQAHFADFIKQVSDQQVPVSLIFCGVGDNLDDLMNAHQSVNRYLLPIRLERLGFTPRIEIIEKAAQVLGIDIDRTSVYRICRISDGFPHYIHLIAEKLFWQVFSARNGGRTEPALFDYALKEASENLEPELKNPYERATKKYTDTYEEVLFAVADKHELQRRSSEIYASYLRIMDSLGKTPLPREKFNGNMNRLKQPAYAEMLLGSRQGWYEFREKRFRGFARLRAAQKGVELEVEHPEEPMRFSYRGLEEP